MRQSGIYKLLAPGKIIAIIDDEPSVLRSLKRLLTNHHYETEVFSSGEAFLTRANVSDVACIVLDIHLDGMSGIELSRRLNERGSTVPIIFITALDSAAVRKEATEAGCAAFLPKPVSGHDLVDTIKRATLS
jgi:FixJ family two-component response regulator